MEINDIINAISIKLYQSFGDGYTIYVDEVPQGFETPAFLIQFLSLEQIQQIGKRWRIVTLFNVQYFPSGRATEAANFTLKVQQALKDIKLINGSIMLGTGANSEVTDGVAHNFINFNFFLQEVEVKELMWSLEQHAKTKG